MSYDIDVIITRTLHSANYTSNVYKMYDLAFASIKDVPEFITDWRSGIQMEQMYSMPILKSMIEEMKKNPEKYKKLNPKNGWGNYEGALKFFEDAYNAMLISPECKIRLDY